MLQFHPMFWVYLPIVLLSIIVLGFIVTTMIATHLLGPKQDTRHKSEAFECGIESIGDARIPFSVKHFLIAILFVLFDVEIVFLYPWAVNFRALGWKGFIEVILFTGMVSIGIFYLIRHRVFDFEND